jgi:hypothetical protein
MVHYVWLGYGCNSLDVSKKEEKRIEAMGYGREPEPGQLSTIIAAHDSLISAVASSSSGLVASTGHDKYVMWRLLGHLHHGAL